MSSDTHILPADRRSRVSSAATTVNTARLRNMYLFVTPSFAISSHDR